LANSLLKLRTDYKKQEVTTLISKLKELVDNQFAKIDRAVAGIGDYQVSKDFPKFCFTSASWFSMSEDQRQRILKRFQSVLPSLKEHRPPNDSNHITNSTSFIRQAIAQCQDTESTNQASLQSTMTNEQYDTNLIACLAIP